MSDVHIHIGEMLARNARMYPDHTALIERIPEQEKRSAITWGQFDERANRFAHALMAKGIGKGDKVMHLMHNSIEWLVAYFGIVKDRCVGRASQLSFYRQRYQILLGRRGA